VLRWRRWDLGMKSIINAARPADPRENGFNIQRDGSVASKHLTFALIAPKAR
jgi:hypothetical protein